MHSKYSLYLAGANAKWMYCQSFPNDKHSFLRFGHNTKLWVGKNAFSHRCYTTGEYSAQTSVLFT